MRSGACSPLGHPGDDFVGARHRALDFGAFGAVKVPKVSATRGASWTVGGLPPLCGWRQLAARGAERRVWPRAFAPPHGQQAAANPQRERAPASPRRPFGRRSSSSLACTQRLATVRRHLLRLGSGESRLYNPCIPNRPANEERRTRSEEPRTPPSIATIVAPASTLSPFPTSLL